MSFVIPEDRSSCFPLRYVNRSRKLEIEIFRCWCLDKDRLEKAHSVLWIRIGWYAIDRLQRVKWLLKCHAKKNQRLWITDLQATSRLQLRATMKYRATAILTYVIFNDKKSFLKKGKKKYYQQLLSKINNIKRYLRNKKEWKKKQSIECIGIGANYSKARQIRKYTYSLEINEPIIKIFTRVLNFLNLFSYSISCYLLVTSFVFEIKKYQ